MPAIKIINSLHFLISKKNNTKRPPYPPGLTLPRRKSTSDSVDFLITGEGAYDYQSGFGKGVGVLMHLFRSNVKQIFLVCGKISAESIPKLPKYVFPIELTKYFSYEYESITNYTEGIKKACKDIVKQLNF